MASSVSNTAQSVVESGEHPVEEPSMEEILASIKKIIADDEEAQDGKSARERFTHPTDHSNSNIVDDDVEEKLRLAMEAEMHHLAGGLPPPVVAPALAKKPVEPTPTLEERAARIRAEVAASGQGLSSEEKLEKYRLRSKMKMETLAAERAAQRAALEVAEKEKAAKLALSQARFQSSAPAPGAVGVASAADLEPIGNPKIASTATGTIAPAPYVQAPVFVPHPAANVAAQIPTAKDVAAQMASQMMGEKSGEIHSMLADMMRPTIRQWLSDNLPSLVEKLVREEIERVSRGKKAS